MRTIDSAWQLLQDANSISHMQYALGFLMQGYKQMEHNEAKDEQHLNSLVEEMVSLSDALNAPLERSLARIELAVLLAREGRFGEAEKRIQQALEILRASQAANEASQQTFGSAYWLLGCLQIQLGRSRAQVLKNWQRAMNIYEMMQCHPLLDGGGWYRFRLRHMQAEMRAFLSDHQYHAASGSPVHIADEKPPPPNSLQPTLPSIGLFDPARLYASSTPSLEVFNFVSAGPLMDVEDLPEPVETIPLLEEQNSFVIEGKNYQLFSLIAGQHSIRLLTGIEYVVLKVCGDSMNLNNIDDEDYVLTRRQGTASPGDIVVAQLVVEGEAPQSTMKRYDRQGNQVFLRAESTNPANKTYCMDESQWNAQVQIVGLVQAVFKPSNIWMSSSD